MFLIVVDAAGLGKKAGYWSHLKFFLSNAMNASTNGCREQLKPGVFFCCTWWHSLCAFGAIQTRS
jgi:hypothetical protein